METTINTATQGVAQPQSLAIDRQAIGDLAAFWARKLDERNRGALSPGRRLSCEIDKLMYYFQAAEQLPSVELEYLNRAVSFYLIHSPNAAHIKEDVINGMNNTIRIAMFCENYATDVSL